MATFVQQRTDYYVNALGWDQTFARNTAMAESGSVRAQAAYTTTIEMGRTAPTAVGEQVLEQAVGAVVLGASAVLHVKDAADTGALIGEYACPVWAQDVPQPRSFLRERGSFLRERRRLSFPRAAKCRHTPAG